MSIVKIPPERIERFSLTLHPEIDYLSSSMSIVSLGVSEGTSGSAPLRRRPSSLIKELVAPGVVGQASNDINAGPTSRPFNLKDFSMLSSLKVAADQAAAADIAGTSANIHRWVENYLEGVNQSPQPIASNKRIYITRFDPPFSLNDVAIEKSVIRDNLMTFYESRYDLCEMAYTNYHSLNFFSAPEGSESPEAGSVERIPNSSAIIYQNFSTSSMSPRPYSPSGSFSMDFYINPRYPNSQDYDFKAGTILHLSSTFCLSLVSGTSRDASGLVDGYRLMLQLSHSADISPSTVGYSELSTYPRDLIFLSGDNSLTRNRWHHCTVRWGTNTTNKGTGSILINSNESKFVVPSSSILPPKHISNSALVVGNYFEGNSNEAQFFNRSTTSEGVMPTLDFGAGYNVDPVYTMDHPLNAELHELKIFNKFISSDERRNFSQSSAKKYADGLVFYVPPMFIPDVHRKDMLITPFQKQVIKSSQPFNEIFSFGVGGFVMNLENHVKDFVTDNQPRCLNLTASTIDTTVVDITATSYCYNTGSIKKRNLTIMPNDNGYFKPDYSLVATASKKTFHPSRRRKHGGIDLSIINLENMISANKIFKGLPTTTVKDMNAALDNDAATLPDNLNKQSIAGLLAGVTPESMGGQSGPILTVAQRTRDRSSNEICFFDISNIYYGDQIQEETLYIVDPSLTGSDGKIKITLRDNGRGGMYRCDAEGPHPKWSNIGNVLYKEGIAFIKSPILTFFGKDCFELKMKGEQNVHVSMINVPLTAGAFNSSSNPSFMLLSASASPSDAGRKFIYIDSLNIHDENLNVIARTNFAQPIKKRVDDSMLIRFKMDF